MEPEGSLPHSQEPVICPSPEPDKSSPRPIYVIPMDQSKPEGYEKYFVWVLGTSLNLTAVTSPLVGCPRLLIRYFAFSPPLSVSLWFPYKITHWSSVFKVRDEVNFYIAYTECHRRNGPNFGRVFLMLNYTDITQNTYVPSWTVIEIMAK